VDPRPAKGVYTFRKKIQAIAANDQVVSAQFYTPLVLLPLLARCDAFPEPWFLDNMLVHGKDGDLQLGV
jgi:hypothetical protein